MQDKVGLCDVRVIQNIETPRQSMTGKLMRDATRDENAGAGLQIAEIHMKGGEE